MTQIISNNHYSNQTPHSHSTHFRTLVFFVLLCWVVVLWAVIKYIMTMTKMNEDVDISKNVPFYIKLDSLLILLVSSSSRIVTSLYPILKGILDFQGWKVFVSIHGYFRKKL